MKPSPAERPRPIRRAARAIALAFAALSSTGPAWTQTPAAPQQRTVAPQRHVQAPGYYRMPLGDFELTALSDGTVKIPLDRLMSNIGATEARKLLDEGFESTPPEASINAFLLHLGNRLVLIDTGAGNLFGDGAGHLLESLKAAGYGPEDIDAILITHLHKDHSGGLTRDGKAVFPRATVYVEQADRAFRFDRDAESRAAAHHRETFAQSREALAPYEAAGRVVLFEAGTQLFPGVRTRAARGHTPGHTLYEVESKEQKIVFIGDVIHSQAIQFARPLATIQFDNDPAHAAKDRGEIMRDLAAGRTLVGAAHISFPGLGYIVPQGDGPVYRWIPRPYSR